MAGKVFVSYAREDGEFAKRLVQDLRGAGIGTWLDQFDIRTGEPWDQAVENALSASVAVLVVLSPSAVSSPSVRDEVSFALDEGKPVTPVLYRKCNLPLRLRRLHYVDFTSDYATGLQELRRSLQEFVATQSAAPELVMPPYSRPDEWEPAARILLLNGKKIEAIKAVREGTGLGLVEARNLVEWWSPGVTDRIPVSQTPAAAWESKARALLTKGLKIDAIKLVRESTGLGLKEAKDLVESW